MADRMLRLFAEIKKIRYVHRCFYAGMYSKIRIKTKHVESCKVLSPDQGSNPCSSTKDYPNFTIIGGIRFFITVYTGSS